MMPSPDSSMTFNGASPADLAGLTSIAGELVTERLRFGHNVCFTITSSSMRPWLKPGEQVIVRAAAPAALRVGDVVVMRTPQGKWCAHRLIRRQRPLTLTQALSRGSAGVWVTKGDGTPYADEPLLPGRIAGVVVASRTASRAGTYAEPRWVNWRTPVMHWAGVLTALVSRAEGAAARLGLPVVQWVVTKCARAGIRLLHGLVWPARR